MEFGYHSKDILDWSVGGFFEVKGIESAGFIIFSVKYFEVFTIEKLEPGLILSLFHFIENNHRLINKAEILSNLLNFVRIKYS